MMKNLHIPNPCSENWETMSSREKGRFCSVCSKCVIDFTEKKSEEIEFIFKEKQGEDICGKFLSHQLNRRVGQSEKLKSRFLKYVPQNFQNNRITPAIFSLVVFLIGCSKPKEKTCAVIGEAKIEEDSLPSNNSFVLGKPMILNDSVAQLHQKDSLQVKHKK